MRIFVFILALVISLYSESYISPLVKYFPDTKLEKGYYLTRIWIEEDITDWNKTPIIKKIRYILDGNWYTRVNENEYYKNFEKERTITKAEHKIYERIVFELDKAVITTIYKSGKTSTIKYYKGSSILHN